MKKGNLLEIEENKMSSDNQRLSVHHIGGRNGGRAFPILRRFEKDIINVLYDADPDCLAQIKEKNQNLESELHVLQYCLADTCKSTSFNINYDPYTSSLCDPDPNCNLYYFFTADCDYLLSEVLQVMEKRCIETVTIDHIFQSTNIPAPTPDFLSIDTQGSEYEVLLGAKETLKTSVVALIVEVEFHPLYKDQKLFGDLAKLLFDQGFNFARFLGLSEVSPYRAPIGLRGEGFHAYTDALFLRRMDNMESIEDELIRYSMLRKLAFIAILFNQFEYGLECLKRSKDSVDCHSVIQEVEPVYLRFLRELEQHLKRMPTVYPPTFVSKYPSFAASKSRFESSAVGKTEMVNKSGAKQKIKQLLRQTPLLFLLLLQVKQLLSSLIKWNLFEKYSDIEKLLINYGLEKQAEVLMKNRLIQSQFCRKP